MRLLFLLVLSACQPEKVLHEYNTENFLKSHNHQRYLHGLQKLKWSFALEKHAISWAQHLSQECRTRRSEDSGFAELSYQSYGRADSIMKVVAYWFSYSQILKRNQTQLVGCAISTCTTRHDSPSTIFVCNYSPEYIIMTQ